MSGGAVLDYECTRVLFEDANRFRLLPGVPLAKPRFTRAICLRRFAARQASLENVPRNHHESALLNLSNLGVWC
jgi:hypothetical protein